MAAKQAKPTVVQESEEKSTNVILELVPGNHISQIQYYGSDTHFEQTFPL